MNWKKELCSVGFFVMLVFGIESVTYAYHNPSQLVWILWFIGAVASAVGWRGIEWNVEKRVGKVEK